MIPDALYWGLAAAAGSAGAVLTGWGLLGVVQDWIRSLRRRRRDMDQLALRLLLDSGPLFPVEFIHGGVPRWGLKQRLDRLWQADLIGGQQTGHCPDPLFDLTAAGLRRAKGVR